MIPHPPPSIVAYPLDVVCRSGLFRCVAGRGGDRVNPRHDAHLRMTLKVLPLYLSALHLVSSYLG